MAGDAYTKVAITIFSVLGKVAYPLLENDQPIRQYYQQPAPQ
ncbi:hypothetical protein [Gilliamella intestini]|nr:hypothetical protein [Gilliamella intestini]